MKFSYGWVVVGIGALMTCIGMGAMMSLAVYLAPISGDRIVARRRVGQATLNFLCMGIAGFAWGALSDRFGTRIVVLCGAVLLGVGLVGASQGSRSGSFS